MCRGGTKDLSISNFVHMLCRNYIMLIGTFSLSALASASGDYIPQSMCLFTTCICDIMIPQGKHWTT